MYSVAGDLSNRARECRAPRKEKNADVRRRHPLSDGFPLRADGGFRETHPRACGHLSVDRSASFRISARKSGVRSAAGDGVRVAHRKDDDFHFVALQKAGRGNAIFVRKRGKRALVAGSLPEPERDGETGKASAEERKAKEKKGGKR